MTDDVPAALILNPATRLLWRSVHSVQLELGGRAVVVDGLAAPTVQQLVPPRTRGRGRSEPRLDDAPDPATSQVLGTLAEAGFLWPRPEDQDEDDPGLAPPEPRLAAELTSLTVRHGVLGAEQLNARRRCAVSVQGGGRVGPHLAAVLAAAGIGRVHVLDRSLVRLNQVMPGGVGPLDEGTPLDRAAAAAIERAAPRTDTTPLPLGQRPDLILLAVDEPIDGERRDALHARDCAHLVIRLASDRGVVGPLVIPGLTSCLRCADLHRLDRDPAWTALAVQLGIPPRFGNSSEVALATAIVGIAAMQALTYLDGGQPATVEGTLELHPPDFRVRRRSWPIHPDCDCTRPA